LFDSLGKVKIKNLIVLILTGMGTDGAQKMKMLFEAGAHTIAQSEESCVVFGMPREAIKLNAVRHTLGLETIPEKIVELMSERSAKSA
jgi:two-component system chemotaxis response regulator CheB